MQIIQGSPTELASPTLKGSGSSRTSKSPSLNTPNPLPFFSISGQLPTAKPMGSKICRWVQNDGTVCGKAFSKLDSLRRHVNELHKGVRPYACNMCDKSYGRRDYLDRHMRTHDKSNKGKVRDMDGDEDADDIGLGVLMAGDEEVPPPPKIPKKKRKDIPPEEKKICLWILDDGTACGKTFTKFDSLKRHVSEAHKSIRPYGCTLCGKNYGRRDYLLRHLKSHSEVEVSKVQIQKVRNNPSNHPANIGGDSAAGGGEATNTPGLPNINFSSLAPQQDPMVSSPIKITPAPAPSAAALKRKALEDKKTCKWTLENGSICGKTFSKHDSLRRHVDELHKNIRPFVCELCDKSYGRKDYLDRHKRTHEADGDTIEKDDSNLLTLSAADAGDTIVTTDDVVNLDPADIEIGGAITGHVVDSDEESMDEDDMVVVGDGGLDPLSSLTAAAGGKKSIHMPGVPMSMTKTLRITDTDESVLPDMETTTTTTVVVEGLEDDEDDEDGVLASVVTVVSNDDV